MTGHRLVRLGRAEALRLLGSVAVGRIVFTEQALPTIRPVNHHLDKGVIVLRTNAGAALMSSVDTVVAYEADHLDPGEQSVSWSVIATGYLRRITAPEAVARYERILRPWVSETMDQVLRIQPAMVTGFTLTAEDGGRAP